MAMQTHDRMNARVSSSLFNGDAARFTMWSLRAVLLASTSSFDTVLGALPSGLERLRRLVRAWSGGKRRALSRQILVPDRCSRDAGSGRDWCADTKEANRAE